MVRTAPRQFAAAFAMWMPILAVLGLALWLLAVGILHLEVNTYGSEFFVKNSETANTPTWRMESSGNAENAQAGDLIDAYNSGDMEQMNAALDRYEARQSALAQRDARG